MRHLKTFENYSSSDMNDWEERYNQLLMDMEEESEPEGGPIADQYAKELEELEAEKERMNPTKGGELTYKQVMDKKNGVTEDPVSEYESESTWITSKVNNNQLETLSQWVEDGRDDNFLTIRLDFYGLEKEDISKVISIIRNRDIMYEMGF